MPWMRLSHVLGYIRRRRIDPALISVYLTRDDLNQLRLTPSNLATTDTYLDEEDDEEDLTEEE